jgi:hypothetical protein
MRMERERPVTLMSNNNNSNFIIPSFPKLYNSKPPREEENYLATVPGSREEAESYMGKSRSWNQ